MTFRWLKTDVGLAVLIASFSLLVSTAIVLAAIALTTTAKLADPTDQQVVARLQRGVEAMNRHEAKEIIGLMLRKAHQKP